MGWPLVKMRYILGCFARFHAILRSKDPIRSFIYHVWKNIFEIFFDFVNFFALVWGFGVNLDVGHFMCMAFERSKNHQQKELGDDFDCFGNLGSYRCHFWTFRDVRWCSRMFYRSLNMIYLKKSWKKRIFASFLIMFPLVSSL